MRSLASIVLALSLAGCGTNPTVIPSSGSILPNAVIQLTPTLAYTSEQIAGAALVAGLIYIVYDPLAPNWAIEEKRLNENTYFLALRAKSFRTGGDGEAIQVVKRRALQLQHEQGYADYRILDYSEGIESSTPLTHRVSESTIQLVHTSLPPTP